MSKEYEFTLKLEVPLTILCEEPLSPAQIALIVPYLHSVLDIPGMGGRLCFNGELFHHTLRTLAAGLACRLGLADMDMVVFSALPIPEKDPAGMNYDWVRLALDDATSR